MPRITSEEVIETVKSLGFTIKNNLSRTHYQWVAAGTKLVLDINHHQIYPRSNAANFRVIHLCDVASKDALVKKIGAIITKHDREEKVRKEESEIEERLYNDSAKLLEEELQIAGLLDFSLITPFKHSGPQAEADISYKGFTFTFHQGQTVIASFQGTRIDIRLNKVMKVIDAMKD